MNFKQKMISERNVVSQLKMDSRFGSKAGLFNEHVSNTQEHELAKYIVYSYLKRNGYTVYTEAKFADESGRCDILAIKDGYVLVIEILESEKEETFKNKKYPFDTVKVRAREVIRDCVSQINYDAIKKLL